MPNLVGDDLPFHTPGGGHSRSGHYRGAAPTRGLLAESRKPGDADLGTGRAAAHKMPQARAVVALLSSPL